MQTSIGSPLMMASVEGHKSVVEVLLKAKADPNYQKKVRMKLYHGVTSSCTNFVLMASRSDITKDVVIQLHKYNFPM